MTSTGTSAGPSAPVTEPETGHRWLKLLVLVVLLLVLAELGTRLIASHLPPPLQWDTYETQAKVAQIDALAKQGGAQIVFLGSSTIDVGADPTTVDAQLGGHVRGYNAGLESAIPRLTAKWAEYEVIPKLHPKVIVIGLSSYDLGAEDPGRTGFYDAYLGSPGAQQLMGTADPIQEVDYWLGQHSSLWFHKYQLRDPETVWHAIEGKAPAVDPSAAALTAQGRQTADQYLPYQDLTTVDLKGWRLGNKDTAALRGLISFAHHRGIKVVLVDMPVAPQFVTAMPHGAASYEIFDSELASIGRQTSSTVLFYQRVSSDSLFFNNIHLNHTGAELFSARLGAALARIVH